MWTTRTSFSTSNLFVLFLFFHTRFYEGLIIIIIIIILIHYCPLQEIWHWRRAPLSPPILTCTRTLRHILYNQNSPYYHGFASPQSLASNGIHVRFACSRISGDELCASHPAGFIQFRSYVAGVISGFAFAV